MLWQSQVYRAPLHSHSSWSSYLSVRRWLFLRCIPPPLLPPSCSLSIDFSVLPTNTFRFKWLKLPKALGLYLLAGKGKVSERVVWTFRGPSLFRQREDPPDDGAQGTQPASPSPGLEWWGWRRVRTRQSTGSALCRLMIHRGHVCLFIIQVFLRPETTSQALTLYQTLAKNKRRIKNKKI